MKKTSKYYLKPFSGTKGKFFGGSLDILRRGPDLVASGTIQTATGDTLTGVVTWVASTSRVVVDLRSTGEQADAVVLELPIQSQAAEVLLPIARRDQPWDCWSEIDAFMRAAVQRLNVPNQVLKDIDHDLEVMTAIHSASVERKPLPRLPRLNSRRRALISLSEDDLDALLEGKSEFIGATFNSRQIEAKRLRKTAELMMEYRELFDEKVRRSGQTDADRRNDLINVALKEDLLTTSLPTLIKRPYF